MADEHGFFIMCAADHRDSLRRMLGRGDPESASYQDMVDFKLDLVRAVGGGASAALLDPVFGAAQALAAGVLPGGVGLVVSTEATGYQGTVTERVTNLLAGWSAAKIKRMGASGAKILLYYNPDLPDVAAAQRDLLGGLAQDCVREDLALVVEPVSYSPVAAGDATEREAFARQKPRIVVETARELTQMPIDILKAEFPADLRYEQDERTLLGYCRSLDEASAVPWILLSAGVGFDDFLRQVRIASQAGASGFLAGRALWQEAVELPSRKQRAEFFSTIVVERLAKLADAAHENGRPWWEKYRSNVSGAGAFTPVPSEGWYRTY